MRLWEMLGMKDPYRCPRPGNGAMCEYIAKNEDEIVCPRCHGKYPPLCDLCKGTGLLIVKK